MRTPTPGPVIIALVALLAGAVMFATTSVTVADGDTLSAIAARHGVSTTDLIAWNDIDDPDRIYVGDVILLVGPAPGAGEEPVLHVVSAGETLTVIAARYGETVARIAADNDLPDVDDIRVGQRLAIGGSEPSGADPSEGAVAPAPAIATEHTVAAGDTLFSIARRYDRTVAVLAAANDITDTDRIRAGTVLLIPAADADAETPDADAGGTEPTPAPAEEPPTEPDEADETSDRDGGETDADGADDEPAPKDAPDGEPPEPPAARAAPDPAASAAELADAFELWSISYGVDQALLEAITWYASDWDPSRVGIDGRIGIAQLTEAQVELVEERLLGRDLDPFDGPDGVRLAARYLRYVQDRTESEAEALMAFRQGLDAFAHDGPTADAEAFALAVGDIRDQRG